MKIKALLFSIIALPILVINFNLARSDLLVTNGDNPSIENNLRFLEHSINIGGAEEMQRLYPEGAFFLHALYSLAQIQYAREQSSEQEVAAHLDKAKAGITNMQGELTRFEYLNTLSPPYGVFLSGWLNWAKSTHDIVAQQHALPIHYEQDVKAESANIAAAFEAADTPYLESYWRAAWPSDNVVAIASLKSHDQLYGDTYSSVITNWLADVKTKLAPSTGMFPYEADHRSGNPASGSHGNAQAVIIRFLAELDMEFANSQFELFHQHFRQQRLGLQLIREYPIGKSGPMSVDSGPVIWDVGAAATMVGQIPYRIFGDDQHADKIISSINALGFPITLDGKTQYAFGHMPVADSFLTWGSLVKLYTEKQTTYELADENRLWKVWVHLVSLGLLIGLGVLVFIKEIKNIWKK